MNELQKEFDTLKEENKLNEAIETGKELLQQSIDLKGEEHPDSVKIAYEAKYLTANHNSLKNSYQQENPKHLSIIKTRHSPTS